MFDPTESRDPSYLKPALLETAYNEFLFAEIGTDASGTSLTVVSALARLDLDPWTVAANLARLPGSIAIQKLAEMIARFPEIPAVPAGSPLVAARLTALLPGRHRLDITAPEITLRNLPPSAQTRMSPRFILALLFITITVLFGTQMIMAQTHPAKTHSSAQSAAAHPVKTPIPGGAGVRKTGN